MKNKEIKKGEILIYKRRSGPSLDVHLKNENVWMSLNQISNLFEIDKSGVSRHINNIFKEKELKKKGTVAKIATVQKEGKRDIERNIEYYNLDMILSVGYRINSKRATQFRIWATKTLKDHLVKGYTINKKRLIKTQNKLKDLQETITFLQEKSKSELFSDQRQEILNLLANYSKTLSLLEKYDKDKLVLVKKAKQKVKLEYEKTREIINEIKKELIKKKEASSFFGQENSDKLKGILGAIYQTFERKQLYPSLEEKSAHLLYFIIKDHPFIDGNKRIGSFLFVYFLDKNRYLYKKTGEKKISDNTLTALSLLIAISHPKEKDGLIKILTNLIAE